MSGLEATVTRSTDTCGEIGAGVMGVGVLAATYRFCAGAFIQPSQLPCPVFGGAACGELGVGLGGGYATGGVGVEAGGAPPPVGGAIAPGAPGGGGRRPPGLGRIMVRSRRPKGSSLLVIAGLP